MKNYSKAIAGFVGAAIIAFLGAQDGGVTQAEWLQILVAAVLGSGLVVIAPKNVKVAGKHEGGQVDVGLALLVGIFIGVVLLLFRVHLGG